MSFEGNAKGFYFYLNFELFPLWVVLKLALSFPRLTSLYMLLHSWLWSFFETFATLLRPFVVSPEVRPWNVLSNVQKGCSVLSIAPPIWIGQWSAYELRFSSRVAASASQRAMLIIYVSLYLFPLLHLLGSHRLLYFDGRQSFTQQLSLSFVSQGFFFWH